MFLLTVKSECKRWKFSYLIANVMSLINPSLAWQEKKKKNKEEKYCSSSQAQSNAALIKKKHLFELCSKQEKVTRLLTSQLRHNSRTYVHWLAGFSLVPREELFCFVETHCKWQHQELWWTERPCFLHLRDGPFHEIWKTQMCTLSKLWHLFIL